VIDKANGNFTTREGFNNAVFLGYTWGLFAFMPSSHCFAFSSETPAGCDEAEPFVGAQPLCPSLRVSKAKN